MVRVSIVAVELLLRLVAPRERDTKLTFHGDVRKLETMTMCFSFQPIILPTMQ